MFFGWFDAIFSFIFPILFLLFIGMFFFALISNLRTWNKNNHSPRLTVPATVVAKRTDVSHSSSANAGDMSGAHGYDTSTFTSYYVTFQVESGDRMEFEVLRSIHIIRSTFCSTLVNSFFFSGFNR